MNGNGLSTRFERQHPFLAKRSSRPMLYRASR
jgi:hypothetical protein